MSTWSFAEKSKDVHEKGRMFSRRPGESAQSVLLEEILVNSMFATYFKPTGSLSQGIYDQSNLPEALSGIFSTTPLLREARPPRGKKLAFNYPAEASEGERKINSDRVVLLARKYATKDKFSDEENARLAIVTEKVRQLLPSVSTEEFEQLAQVLERVKVLAQENQKIRLALQNSAPKK